MFCYIVSQSTCDFQRIGKLDSISFSPLTLVGSEGVDSSGGRRSANRSAGRTKPFVADNDDSFSFGGAKDVGEFISL